MSKNIKNALTLLAFAAIPTFFLWIPFFFNFESLWKIPLPQRGIGTVVANYDGPLYIVLAKTFYNTDVIRLTYSFPLPLEYYAAHFPMFPVLIRVFSILGNYAYSMLFVTIVSSFLSIYFFQKLSREYVDEKSALWMSFVFSVFPARWLTVRSVGSAEPLFIGAIIASLYYFKKKRYLWAGVWGAVAQLTKSPGILLFVAYILSILLPSFKKVALATINKTIHKIEINKLLPLLLIPFSLIGVFYFYQYSFGSFWAYFKSGDNIHLFFPPFQIFNYSQPWVDTFWLEDVIFVYLFGILGLLKLVDQKENTFSWFVGVFFTTILFVSHRDALRYALPIVPFLMIGYRDFINSRQFKIAMAVLIIPIYLYSLVHISQNTMPIADWGPLL